MSGRSVDGERKKNFFPKMIVAENGDIELIE